MARHKHTQGYTNANKVSDVKLPKGITRDAAGNLCVGEECFNITVKPDAIEFNLNETKCDPEITKQVLKAAQDKGAILNVIRKLETPDKH